MYSDGFCLILPYAASGAAGTNLPHCRCVASSNEPIADRSILPTFSPSPSFRPRSHVSIFLLLLFIDWQHVESENKTFCKRWRHGDRMHRWLRLSAKALSSAFYADHMLPMPPSGGDSRWVSYNSSIYVERSRLRRSLTTQPFVNSSHHLCILCLRYRLAMKLYGYRLIRRKHYFWLCKCRHEYRLIRRKHYFHNVFVDWNQFSVLFLSALFWFYICTTVKQQFSNFRLYF